MPRKPSANYERVAAHIRTNYPDGKLPNARVIAEALDMKIPAVLTNVKRHRDITGQPLPWPSRIPKHAEEPPVPDLTSEEQTAAVYEAVIRVQRNGRSAATSKAVAVYTDFPEWIVRGLLKSMVEEQVFAERGDGVTLHSSRFHSDCRALRSAALLGLGVPEQQRHAVLTMVTPVVQARQQQVKSDDPVVRFAAQTAHLYARHGFPVVPRDFESGGSTTAAQRRARIEQVLKKGVERRLLVQQGAGFAPVPPNASLGAAKRLRGVPKDGWDDRLHQQLQRAARVITLR